MQKKNATNLICDETITENILVWFVFRNTYNVCIYKGIVSKVNPNSFIIITGLEKVSSINCFVKLENAVAYMDKIGNRLFKLTEKRLKRKLKTDKYLKQKLYEAKSANKKLLS